MHIVNHIEFFFNLLWTLENAALCEHALEQVQGASSCFAVTW
nr:MAG TPA: hypothetical protein [Caudoviricetes sp.]